MRPIDDCFQDKQLSPISKLVYLFLRHKSKGESISISFPKIANELALSKDAIYRAMKPLHDWQFITSEQSGSSPAIYYIS